MTTIFPTYDLHVLNQAMLFAMGCHAGQLDKAGLPYVFHPIGVARRAMMRGAPQHVVVAAFLHDVIEDCRVPAEEIEERFGAEVARVVLGVSRFENETYAQFIDRVCLDPRCALLKLCDTDDNLDEERMFPLSPQEQQFLRKRYGKSRPKLLAASGGGS
jgi:(p)ppGpp synthase/HD superfamily hydrolase